MSSKNIIGLRKNIVDEATGVPTSFHVVAGISLDYSYGIYGVTIGSYYDEGCCKGGKKMVNSVQLMLNVPPPRDVDLIDWALSSVADTANEKSPFSGAELVKDK
jgi:hypothetical protein